MVQGSALDLAPYVICGTTFSLLFSDLYKLLLYGLGLGVSVRLVLG